MTPWPAASVGLSVGSCPHSQYILTLQLEAEVLDFWRHRGLLLPDDQITDAAIAAEQRMLRRRVTRCSAFAEHTWSFPTQIKFCTLT